MNSSTASSYIPIRDDSSSIRSLSLNERAFLSQSSTSNTTSNSNSNNNSSSSAHSWRADGRRAQELRHIQIASLGRWEDGAECTVQWGMTRVTCLVSSQMTTPMDRPNEGMLYFSVDLSPMASTSWVHAPAVTTAPRGNSTNNASIPPLHDVSQKLLSNRILRTLERVVLTSGVMDLEALCVVSGQWVWKLHVSVTVLDMGGNLVDAAVLSCMAALSHYRQPQVSVSGGTSSSGGDTNNPPTTTSSAAAPILISPDFQQATPLPLHHIPLTISFGLLPVSADNSSSADNSTTPSKHAATGSSVVAWIDPTDREELVMTGTLTMAMNIHGEVCWLDVHGCELPPYKLRECGQMAQQAIVKLCGFLEERLQQAEEQAQRDRLQRLQQRQEQHPQPESQLPPPTTDSSIQLPPLPPTEDIQVPFWQGISEANVVGMESMEVVPSLLQQQQQELLLKQEDDYRNMALDYSLGHVAAKVKENKPSSQAEATQSTSSLLAALLKSAASAQSEGVVSRAAGAPAAAEQQQVAQSKETKKTEPSTTSSAAATAAIKQESSNVDNNHDEDDDEEPTTMVWQSEFGAVAAKPSTATQTPPPPAATSQPDDDEDDVDDLAMAIRKKKSKKKGKK